MSAAQARGLGKGLSALMSEGYSNQMDGAQIGAEGVAVDALHAGIFQPRGEFDDEQLKELSQSIAKNGIMQPIIVRASKKAKEQFEIIAGERRWRAAKLAGLEHVPVLVRDISDQQALELALVENIQRQDLSPLEEANGYQRLIDEFGYTQDELSETVGKSRSHIANLLRLLVLPDQVKSLMGNGKITMGHARAILKSDTPVEVAQEIARKGLNVRQAERLVRRAGEEKHGPRTSSAEKPGKGDASSGRSARPSGSGEKDPDIIALEETLSENLGLSVTIEDDGNSGAIVISYESLEQLDDILRRLGGSI